MASKFPVSPLAPAAFPGMPEVAGVRMAVFATGMRYQGRADLLLMAFDKGTSMAGMFTTSRAPSAPVDWCRSHLPKGFGAARAVLVNAGNANAFTGRQGDRAARQCAEAAAKLLGCPKGQVMLGSTGVIGVPLEHEKITGVLPEMVAHLRADGWSSAAEAIRTTDTFAKAATATAMIDGVEVRISGIAKGSGMIAPDMATMLAYVVTDAKIPPAVLHALLKQAVNQSFNMISVDGDTSTSDTVLLFATGKAKHRPITRAGDPRLRDFRARLNEVMRELAHQVVRDGEGARKFISVKITGAASPPARRIAMSVANSPLVKTAIAGEDANWGRIVMAIGKSAKRPTGTLCASASAEYWWRKGAIDPAYREEKLSAYMKGAEILIEADVGVGRAAAEVWTCDLTHGYIDINADYRS